MLKSAVDHITDCALHCLGISRADAVDRLLRNADDYKVRELMAPEIEKLLVEPGPALPWQVMDVPELAALVAHRDDQNSSFDERLRKACRSKAVFVAFVKFVVATRGKWPVFLIPIDRKHRASSIDAIAYLLNTNVEIWTPARFEDNGVIVVSEAHVFVHDPTSPFLRMLHTDNNTHFQRLHELPEGSEMYERGQFLVEQVREQIVNNLAAKVLETMKRSC